MTGKTGDTGDARHKTGRDYVQETARLYDNIVDWYVESFWTDVTDQDWIEICLQRIPRNSIVADIGSGPGNYAQYFLARGHKTYCIDISEQMVREVQKRLPLAVAKVGDMRQLPLEDDSIDCVFCAYSINHVTSVDIGKVLSEFARIAKRGGLIILFLKEGKGQYDFTARDAPGSKGIMVLYDSLTIKELLQRHHIKTVDCRAKDDTSQHEFSHRKIFIIGTKL